MRVEGLYRVDIPEISAIATREALVNAFYHRDYDDCDAVRIGIFKDRVEIRNPGKLCNGLTIDQIRSSGVSFRRNPIVASILDKIKMTKGWCHNIPRIMNEEPLVDFKECAHLFIVKFPRPSFSPDYYNKPAAKNESHHISRQLQHNIADIPQPSQQTSVNSKKQTSHHVSIETCILNAIRKNKFIKIKELSEITNITNDGVRYHTDRLQKKGIIVRIGTFNGHWKILKDPADQMNTEN